MKRYLLFAGWSYYPEGGWNDYRGSFESLEEARLLVSAKPDPNHYDWWHIVDTESGEEVERHHRAVIEWGPKPR